MPTVETSPLGARVNKRKGRIMTQTKCDECGKPATTYVTDDTGTFPVCKRCKGRYGV